MFCDELIVVVYFDLHFFTENLMEITSESCIETSSLSSNTLKNSHRIKIKNTRSFHIMKWYNWIEWLVDVGPLFWRRRDAASASLAHNINFVIFENMPLRRSTSILPHNGISDGISSFSIVSIIDSSRDCKWGVVNTVFHSFVRSSSLSVVLVRRPKQ